VITTIATPKINIGLLPTFPSKKNDIIVKTFIAPPRPIDAYLPVYSACNPTPPAVSLKIVFE